jgi:nucleotide-binding universal stress UspA family protein
MITRILVPLDGSELSEEALPYAVEIARRADGEIVLITAIQPVGIWDATASAINWEREEKVAEEYLEERREHLEAHQVKARQVRMHGDAAVAILEASEDEAADLIVMSTHGRSGITRWLFGSVADRVINHSLRPLLVIRPGDGEAGRAPVFKKILVPLDGSRAAESVLPFVKEIAGLFDSSLVLYHAIPPISAYPGFETVNPPADGRALEDMQRQARELLSERARRLEGEGIKTTIAVSVDLPMDGILHAAEETGADLIAIGTHGRSGLGRLLLGSVASGVTSRARIPCLLMRPREE